MNERQQEEDFSALQRLMVNLVQSNAGRPIDASQAWLNDAQALARKMYQHIASLRALTNANRVEIDENQSFEFIDHSSAMVVARAAFETYLVFYFIFGGSNRSLSEFRHKIWRYAGLIDRQKPHAVSAGSRETQATEKLAIERLKREIEASPHLGAYKPEAAKRILKGGWRGGESWIDLGMHAGFHEIYFRNLYGYLCGNSHASYISAMQVGQAQIIDDQRRLASVSIGVGVVLMAHFAGAYTELFDEARPVLEADQVAKAAVSRWGFSAEDWAKTIINHSGP